MNLRHLVVIPSVLSALRLGLAVWFPFAPRDYRPMMLIAAAASDFVDGYIARQFNLATWVGGLLDSLADKLFAVSALVTFMVGGELAGWQAGVLLSRDIAVALIALDAATHRSWYAFRHMPARPFGKLTTAAMFLYFMLLAASGPQAALTWIAFGIAGTFSFCAAVDYLRVFRHARRVDRRARAR